MPPQVVSAQEVSDCWGQELHILLTADQRLGNSDFLSHKVRADSVCCAEHLRVVTTVMSSLRALVRRGNLEAYVRVLSGNRTLSSNGILKPVCIRLRLPHDLEDIAQHPQV